MDLDTPQSCILCSRYEASHDCPFCAQLQSLTQYYLGTIELLQDQLQVEQYKVVLLSRIRDEYRGRRDYYIHQNNMLRYNNFRLNKLVSSMRQQSNETLDAVPVAEQQEFKMNNYKNNAKRKKNYILHQQKMSQQQQQPQSLNVEPAELPPPCTMDPSLFNNWPTTIKWCGKIYNNTQPTSL